MATARKRTPTARRRANLEERATLNGLRSELMFASHLRDESDFRKAYARWNPGNAEAAHRLVREYTETHPVPFVATVVRLKAAFLDFRRELEPVNGETGTEAELLRDWLRAPLSAAVRTTGAQLVDKLCADVCAEWVAQDSAVISWQENSLRPYLLLPEDCRYSSRGGREVLEWRHGLTGTELDRYVSQFGEDMRPAVRKRYEQDFIRIEDADWNGQFPALADYRTVVTRARWGAGLAMPRLRGLIHALGQYQTMELGEAAYAFAGRKVNRQFKAGYAIKSGDQAGTTATNAPKNWPLLAKEAHDGKSGYYETATNWDREQVLHWLDVKNFDPAKWQTVVDRALHWAGPLGSLWLLKGQQLGDLWQLFQAEIQAERRLLAGAIAEVLSQFTPVPVEVCWRDDCFLNPRVRSELFRAAFSAGVVSDHTFAENLGLRLEEEMEHKLQELAAEKANPGVLKPIYDAAHGDPALAAGDAGGRPAGSPDGQ